MADGFSLAGTLQALKAANEIAKVLRSTDVSFERAEIKIKVAELADALSDARMTALDAQEEITRLQSRIKELEARNDVRSRIRLRHSMYYLAEADDKESGPYCVACFETKDRTIALGTLGSSFVAMGRYQCPSCKAFYR